MTASHSRRLQSLLSSVCRNLLTFFSQKVLHVKILHLMFHITKRWLTCILSCNRRWKWCHWWKVRLSVLEYGESDTHLTACFWVSCEATTGCYCHIHSEETWLPNTVLNWLSYNKQTVILLKVWKRLRCFVCSICVVDIQLSCIIYCGIFSGKTRWCFSRTKTTLRAS